MSEIGLRYRELRKRNKLSQKDFVERIGLKQSSLSSIENGESTPSNKLNPI